MLWLARRAGRHRAARARRAACAPAARARLPGRLPHRAERHERQRDRRRLLRRDRRRPAAQRRAALRRLPAGQPSRRHVRPDRVRGVRAVRARVPVGRHAGTTCPPPTPRRSRSTSPAWPACGSPGGGSEGAPLGLLLAYLWAACPFTLLVANSGANDALVAALVLAAFLVPAPPGGAGGAGGARRPDEVRAARARAAVRHLRPCARAQHRGGGDRRRRWSCSPVALASEGSKRSGTARSASRRDRASPFSIWGLYGGLGRSAGRRHARRRRPGGGRRLHPAAARRGDGRGARRGGADRAPARPSTHWFYLYIVWFLPLLLIALLGAVGDHAGSGRRTGSIAAARPSGPQRISTALIHGSSSAGS